MEHIMQIRVPTRMFNEFKVVCSLNDCTLSEVIREFISGILREEKHGLETLNQIEDEIRIDFDQHMQSIKDTLGDDSRRLWQPEGKL